MIQKVYSPILQLPAAVANKIAAGEVVERPASVVKELIENSIDAQASTIDVFIENSGFSSITVADNGTGMSRDDLSLCLLRHATSKISRVEDLYAIKTLGFRGEALASIAAVSCITLCTASDDSGSGIQLCAEAGVCSPMQPVERAQGTTITCNNLFFNTPARKKFMKSGQAEKMAIISMMEQLVLSYPEMHFTCSIDGKRYLDAPSVDTLRMRIAQIYSASTAQQLIQCHGDAPFLSADIYISSPQNVKPRSRFQNLYVNRRRIDNETVLFAIREAFSRFVTAQLRPSWCCFLTVDPDMIDVNIHPTKQKVKFDNEKKVFGTLFNAVHTTIAKTIVGNPAAPVHDGAPDSSGSARASHENTPPPSPMIHMDKTRAYPFSGGSEVFRQNKATVHEVPGQIDGIQTALSFLSITDAVSLSKNHPGEGENRQDGIHEREKSENLISCYQIHRTFIAAPIKNGIIIIDQHAAHERILFEEALLDIRKRTNQSQRLLFPIVFDLSPAEKEILLGIREFLSACGFDIQDFGGATLAVAALPAIGFIKTTNTETTVREIAREMATEQKKSYFSSLQEQFAAAFACGAAIKAGQELKQEEMNALLNNLFAAAEPYTCPHGRPTLIRISLDELSRRFLRS